MKTQTLDKDIEDIDFEERLIIESVCAMKTKHESKVYCFSIKQAKAIKKRYGRPCFITKVDEGIWSVEVPLKKRGPKNKK